MSLPLIIDVQDLAKTLATLHTGGDTLKSAGICLVDLRPLDAYAAGHIAGAVHGDAALLNRAEPPVGGLLPEPTEVNAFLAQIGADMGDQIVAYDGGRETAAARLIWVLDAYGYEANGWVNGGINAWQAKELPLSTDTPSAAAGNLSLSLIGDNTLPVDTLMEHLSAPTVKVLDVRSANEFAGTDVRSARGGHVPGAVHMEWTTLLDAHGRLLSDDILESALKKSGIGVDDTVVVYCQTHQRSAVTYVALKNLGYTDVRALDGAWSNWGNREDTPIET